MKSEGTYEDNIQKALHMVAPGTTFRHGLENVLKAKTGGLLVVGGSPEILNLVSGGFHLNCELTPSNLYELAKMDGAIILDKDATRILIANAQLVPDASVPSSETGIRHRTAERVARQTGELVIAVSQRRGIVTLYKGVQNYVLHEIDVILVKANQALQTLEKYRAVMDRDLIRLGGTEFEDMVMVSEVTRAIQRCMVVLKIAKEIENYIMELGNEGRLVKMQLDELISNVEEEAILIIRDYSKIVDKTPQDSFTTIFKAYEEDVSDAVSIAKILGFGNSASVLDLQVPPRGYRILQKLPRIPGQIIENLVTTFGDFPHILQASIEELDDVEGIGEVRARSIKNGLKRMQEQLILDYMV
ncbi:MAG: DNA integrity scanning diadenylate cyclase DisA [Ignavibacteriales bacterium]